MNTKYTLLHKIGEGSFSTIYKAKNNLTNTTVAIKIANNPDSSLHQQLLLREAKLYNYLKHISGIPKLLWCGLNNSIYYIVMPFYLGTLKDLLLLQNGDNNQLNDDILHIGNILLSILKELHNKNIIHRDIKPDNIMFNEHGKLFLIDLGLCKIYKTNNIHMIHKKITNIIGTINYISLNVHNYNEPSRCDDVESVIYVLLYLLTGSLQWENEPNITNILYIKEHILSNTSISIPSRLFIGLQNVRVVGFYDTPNYIL